MLQTGESGERVYRCSLYYSYDFPFNLEKQTRASVRGNEMQGDQEEITNAFHISILFHFLK